MFRCEYEYIYIHNSKEVLGVAVSPDGLTVASAGDDWYAPVISSPLWTPQVYSPTSKVP